LLTKIQITYLILKSCWLEWKARRLLRDQRPRWDPAGAKRRGGSPDAPRKAKRLEQKSTD